jgi:hypothetical protein
MSAHDAAWPLGTVTVLGAHMATPGHASVIVGH